MSCHTSAPRFARRLALESLEPRQMLYGPLDSGLGGAEGETSPLPDFELSDVNPNSPSSGSGVSPRDYLNSVSGWYLGSAL